MCSFSRVQAIQEQMMQIKAEPVPFQDVSDEIFDMVRPTDPMRITIQDLISSYDSALIVFQCIQFSTLHIFS